VPNNEAARDIRTGKYLAPFRIRLNFKNGEDLVYACMHVRVSGSEGGGIHTGGIQRITAIRPGAYEYNGMLSGHLKFKCCVLDAL